MKIDYGWRVPLAFARLRLSMLAFDLRLRARLIPEMERLSKTVKRSMEEER